MSRLTQLQQELRGIDQAKFQHLCDALLHAKNFGQITQSGTEIGADKVAPGTPDSRILRPDGQFIFVEYTTQQKGTFAKLQEDLKKCFDPAVTGIPASRVHEIIICHNTKLSSAEELALVDQCRRHGIGCTVFGASAICLDLYLHYPAIARDFLGVAMDTGQILGRDDFVREYNKNAIAPPLDTAFRFRIKELAAALEGLDTVPVLIVSGRAGVGKTRFALECADQFCSHHPNVSLHAIYNRGASLSEDIRAAFDRPGHRLILVDDANRLAGLTHVLHILRHNAVDSSAKLILTVRDYAVDRVVDAVRPFGKHRVVTLDHFADTQIRELAAQEYNIENHLILDRIVTIARGNPRLAIMAVRAAQSQDFDQIREASNLYDVYFGSIREDLVALADGDVVAVAGIIAFFRVVDRSNPEMMDLIKQTFGIEPVAFWKSVSRLDELELVDIHGRDIVRLSDQVLATYLFYLVFFKNHLLAFDKVLECLFPRFRQRLMDAIKPVAEIFVSEALTDEVRVHVTRAWHKFARDENDVALLNLADAFGALKPVDTLLLARDYVCRMDPEAASAVVNEIGDLEQHGATNILPGTVLSIMRAFGSLGDDDVQMAVELLCDYLTKKPSDFDRVRHILGEDFGLDRYAALREYKRERAVIAVLRQRAQEGQCILPSKLLLSVASAYLRAEVERTQADNKSVTWLRYHAQLTPELEILRAEIWSAVLGLFECPRYEHTILRMLCRPVGHGFMFDSSRHIASDAPTLVEFVATRLDPSRYAHCVAVRDLLDALDRHGVKYDPGLRERFQNEAFALAEVLTGSNLDRLHLGWQEQQAQWQGGIRALVAEYDTAAFERLIRHCADIMATGEGERSGFRFEWGVSEAILAGGLERPNVFRDVMITYLREGDQLRLPPWGLVERMTAVMGTEVAFELLMHGSFEAQPSWLSCFLVTLPEAEVRSKHFDALCALYERAEVGALPRSLGYLERYMVATPDAAHRVVSILVKRAELTPGVAGTFGGLFEARDHDPSTRVLRSLAISDRPLLRRAYLGWISSVAHADHDGRVFNEFLDDDSGFAEAYVVWIVQRAQDRKWNCYDRNYAFLWRRADYAATAAALVENTYDALCENKSYWGFYPERFFLTGAWDEMKEPEVQTRQDEILGVLLRKRGIDGDFIRAMFHIIANFSSARRLALLGKLMDVNQDMEVFSTLDFVPSHMSWSGSKVPVLEERVNFWRSACGLFRGLEWLDHKKLMEEHLERAEAEIERAKREEFMED